MEKAQTLESLEKMKKTRIDLKDCLQTESKSLTEAFESLIDNSHKSCKKIQWFKNGYLIFTGLVFGSNAGLTLYEIYHNQEPSYAPLISFLYIVCIMVAYEVMGRQFKRTHEMRKETCENSILNMNMTMANIDATLENIELKIEILLLKKKLK